MLVPFLGEIAGGVVAVEPDWEGYYPAPTSPQPPVVPLARISACPGVNAATWEFLDAWVSQSVNA